MDTAPRDRNPPGPLTTEGGEPFMANVTRDANGEWICTISPVPESAQRLLSEWVSATGEDFVSLEDMR
ncbi:DUF7511 domain-containing protein [Halodesulfurarchaeum formicicum]|nr:hypothetical protein [Halodesulfurarchaeum formicicum]